ncbi:MAG: fused MFS/spermidine synthase [Flavobacteriales bacterium]|nr:fused MFS/spermidine synthase [Flavobacteriales bacterium]
MQKSTSYIVLLYVIGFIEGGSLMACEILGPKLIAPFFGTSLYVWTSVLGITLGAMTAGYWVGGNISEKHPTNKTLFYAICTSAVLMLLMPFIARGVMGITINTMGIISGPFFSSLIFLFPPIFVFGTVSPLVIQLASKNIENAGKVAGTVYGISTLGGILGLGITGLYMIPEIGLKMTCVIFGCILFVSAGIFMVLTKNMSEDKVEAPANS